MNSIEYSENERTFLAILIYSDVESIQKTLFKDIMSHTKEEMFFDKNCRIVFEAVKSLTENCLDLVGTETFQRKVKQIAELEEDGLETFVEDLQGYWSNFVTIGYWLEKIQKFYFKQRFKEASTEEEFNEIILEKRKLIRANMVSDISEEAGDLLEKYEETAKTAITTPFEKVNNLIGSLLGGDMVVLAGSSGGGKTCFMLNLAKGIAKKGKKVLIFSLEMPKWQLQQRLICSEARIDASKFRDFSLTLEDKMKFTQYANNDFKKLKISIYNKQTVSMNEIRYAVTQFQPDIVFIDYLGLINSYDSKSSYEKFSNISRDIKLLAMEANVPIVALHQLNRDYQKRDVKRPQTSDLRDSGKIEQDADMIWFVYRPASFEEGAPEDEMDFILAKDRHGEANKEAKLCFNGQYQYISDGIKTYSLGRN